MSSVLYISERDQTRRIDFQFLLRGLAVAGSVIGRFRHTRATQIEGFQIVRRLGRGGMGEVFEAVRTGPGGFRRAVALKRLIPGAAVRGAAVQRFLAEARILSNLHHRNVIEVHDVIASEQGYVLVMELLTGATLGGLVRATDGALPVDELCELADQALAGLDYIHAALGEDGKPLGLIHRDLTPANLFVTDAGEVKLIDFGIAKIQGSLDAPLTRTGEIHGTLEMIAPEIARGEPPDRRTDLYQLAASLYWGITGVYPHGFGTTIELVARAANKRPTPLAELRRDLPPVLVATIDRAMALAPADRFDSAADMRAALRTLVPADGDARLAARVRAVLAAQPREPAAPATADTPAVTETPATVADKASARRSDDEYPGTVAGKSSSRGPAEGAAASKAPRVAGDAAASSEPRPRTADEPRRSGPPMRTRSRWPVAAALIAVAGGVTAVGVELSRRSGSRSTSTNSGSHAVPSTIAEVPNTRGAIAAAPLPGGRIAFATVHGVRIVSERGDSPKDIAIPASTVPIDVDALADDHVAVTVQQADGRYLTLLDGDATHELVYRSATGAIAIHPDATRVARADLHYAGRLENVRGSVSKIVIPVAANSDVVRALAWSPDGKRLAAVHDRGQGDPTFDLVDLDGGTRTYTHRPFGGEVTVFGWADADHLVYAVNHPDGASIIRFALATEQEDVLLRLANERITGGHVAAGTIAFVHAAPHSQLRFGSTHELHAIPGISATSIAGFDTNGHLALGSRDAAPLACTPDGQTSPVPGGAPGDRAQTVIAGTVLAVRGSDVYRLGATTKRLMTASVTSDHAIVRCAGDATAPCIVADWSGRSMSYRGFDPDTGVIARDFVGERGGVDHAVSADGRELAVVDGTEEICLFTLDHGELAWRKVGGGAALEAVAWSGDDLIVAARHWRQHPWALLAVDAESQVRLIAESSADCMPTSIRASKEMIAVLATDATPALSILHVP